MSVLKSEKHLVIHFFWITGIPGKKAPLEVKNLKPGHAGHLMVNNGSYGQPRLAGNPEDI